MTARQSSLLGTFPLLSTSDLSAARNVTARFWSDHVSESLGPESYALEMNRVALATAALTYVDCSTRLRVVATRPSRIANLYVLLSGEIDVFVDGVTVRGSPARPLFRGPYQKCVFECSPARCLVVDLPPGWCGQRDENGASLPPFACLDAEAASDVVRRVTRLARSANRYPMLASLQSLEPERRGGRMPAAVRRAEAAALKSLENLLTGGLPRRIDPRDHFDVERLKAWLEAHSSEPLRMPDLAREAGVSTRTVERAFTRTGCGPLEYLRSVRMENARRMLAAATTDASVASVAQAAGFRHLGRFAAAYQRRFGEKPSAALARSRAMQTRPPSRARSSTP